MSLGKPACGFGKSTLPLPAPTTQSGGDNLSWGHSLKATQLTSDQTEATACRPTAGKRRNHRVSQHNPHGPFFPKTRLSSPQPAGISLSQTPRGHAVLSLCPGEWGPGPSLPMKHLCLSASPRGRTRLDPAAPHAGGTVLTTGPFPRGPAGTPGQNWGVLGEKSSCAPSGAQLPRSPRPAGAAVSMGTSCISEAPDAGAGKGTGVCAGQAPLCWSNSDRPAHPAGRRDQNQHAFKIRKTPGGEGASGETLDNFAEPSGPGK